MVGKVGHAMRLSQLVGHRVEGEACDETVTVGWSWWVREMRLMQLVGHGGERGACDETETIGWSRCGRRGM